LEDDYKEEKTNPHHRVLFGSFDIMDAAWTNNTYEAIVQALDNVGDVATTLRNNVTNGVR
jgi:hypothetical protein